MTPQATRQIALMTLSATCVLLIVLAVAFGLDAAADTALRQALPLAVVAGVAFVILLVDPRQRH